MMGKLTCLSASIFLIALLEGCAGTTPAPPTSQAIDRPNEMAAPASEIRPEFARYFQDFTSGAFVLYDLNNNQYTRYNPDRCAERFIPASTFKIMNSLAGLESGIIPDQDYVIEWDGTPQEFAEWNQDHTLKTAFQYSVIWYYQELARRLGKEKMQEYVDAAQYGNQDISGQIDTFWLEGGLRISPDEQIEFLRRLYTGELPFSKNSMDTVKEIMIIEETGGYTFGGKTGTGVRIVPHVGWFVGYLKTDGNVYVFATNIELQAVEGNLGKAREITESILRDMELKP